MSPEEKVSRGWGDFSFRLGNVPRFFLETKKVNEDLNDPRWVKQAIDYAWTKSVTWALLSGFEGLRVFNAELTIQLNATVTCPQCGFAKQEQMPPATRVVVYQCTSCGATLRPLAGVCCVYCSFGDRQCPSKQREDAEGRKGKSTL